MAAPPAPPPPHGELSRLLETEERLDALIRRARGEAEALVAAAREAVAARERAFATEVEAAERDVAAEAERERDRRAETITAEARAEAARYDAVGPARLDALARLVIDRLLGEPEEPA